MDAEALEPLPRHLEHLDLLVRLCDNVELTLGESGISEDRRTAFLSVKYLRDGNWIDAVSGMLVKLALDSEGGKQ
jgi:hypothetical protein